MKKIEIKFEYTNFIIFNQFYSRMLVVMGARIEGYGEDIDGEYGELFGRIVSERGKYWFEPVKFDPFPYPDNLYSCLLRDAVSLSDIYCAYNRDSVKEVKEQLKRFEGRLNKYFANLT